MIRKHRHSIVHEIYNYLFTSNFDVDIELFNRARDILAKIDSFWFSLDIPIDPQTGDEIDTTEINIDEVFSGREAFLSLSIDAVLEYVKKINA